MKLSDILDNVLTLDVHLIATRIRDPTETWVQGCTVAVVLKTIIYKTARSKFACCSYGCLRQGAEENIWTKDTGSKRGIENVARLTDYVARMG